MTATVRADDAARAVIHDALDETVVVEAAAGTGKTTELVQRILNVLKRGRTADGRPIEVGHLVAVTFTEKAAGELKLRLREALERERSRSGVPDDERDRLTGALGTLEEAHVSTIHGFCAEILRERPVEARVDPLFTVLTETQADRVYARAFRAWFQEQLANPPEGVRRALRRSSPPSFQPGGDRENDGPVERLRNAGAQLRQWRDFAAPWRRPAMDREADIGHLVDALHTFAALTMSPAWDKDRFYKDTEPARRLSAHIKLEQSIDRYDPDGWESRLVDLARDRWFSRASRGGGQKYSAQVSRTQLLAAYDLLLSRLQTFKRDADADLAALLQQELAGSLARYEALKERAGALDYEDLLIKARDLVRDNAAVRRRLQQAFRRIFVDEFQDTDPLQAEILLLLSAADPRETDWRRVTPEHGKLFIVGDPKQAIYRFRRADVGVYRDVCRQLVDRGAVAVTLNTSFRAVPEIQAFVNAAFAGPMQGSEEAAQARYVPLEPDRPAASDQPAVVALPVPRPYNLRGYGRVSAMAIEGSLPDAVGAFTEWLLDSGWTVTERGQKEPRPLEARDICILFRRFVSWNEDATRPYVEALESRGVPHLLVGGKTFHEREEIETMRAALAAIEWPDDELAVFATLKGPLFAIGDEELLEYHHRFHKEHFGALHPFRIPAALGGSSGTEMALDAEPLDHLFAIGDALRLLQRLHRRRNYRPVAETIGALLEATRAHVGLALRQAGDQALANVFHIAELARQYELEGGLSFRGFIDELREAADTAHAAEAPILEESSAGVRLMTVHRAKGLEFPVVILADLTCKLHRPDASRAIDAGAGRCALKLSGWAPLDLLDAQDLEVLRDEAEGVRLAYVAATRARDLLVVPAVGDEAWAGGWLDPLNAALYPPAAGRRNAAKAPQCPSFRSKDTVLARPNDDPASAETVCPGLHTFPGGYRVVWWDPGSLNLDISAGFGIRRDDLIVKSVSPALVAEDRQRYERWRADRAGAAAAGIQPSLRVVTAREWAEGAAESLSTAEVEVVEAPGREPRPTGAAFGLLVHAVLAAVPFDADDAAVARVAETTGRIFTGGAAGAGDAGEDDVRAAARAASRALASPILRRARAADARGRARREAPVTVAAPDGTLVEGIVDLAFEEDGRWIVVDYKSDREILAEGEERYRRQVALYAAAIAQATGQAASAVIVRV